MTSERPSKSPRLDDDTHNTDQDGDESSSTNGMTKRLRSRQKRPQVVVPPREKPKKRGAGTADAASNEISADHTQFRA